MGACSFDGCEKQAACKGLCSSHYQQQRQGKPLKPLQVQHHGLSEIVRFMRRVEKSTPDACWNWIGSRIGHTWHGQWRNSSGQHELTHRAAWRMLVGEIPKDAFVLHRCDNPVCVNPAHLFLGTQSDNAFDMWAKKRARPKSSIGENHGMSKITKEMVAEIRSSNESGVALAKKFGISATSVCDIRKRRTWNHIP